MTYSKTIDYIVFVPSDLNESCLLLVNKPEQMLGSCYQLDYVKYVATWQITLSK